IGQQERELRGLRAFAAAVFQAGAGSVLMVPPLPSNLARAVVEVFARELGVEINLDRSQLFAILKSIRRLLATHETKSLAVQKIQALPNYPLQVTLFARSEPGDLGIPDPAQSAVQH